MGFNEPKNVVLPFTDVMIKKILKHTNEDLSKWRKETGPTSHNIPLLRQIAIRSRKHQR